MSQSILENLLSEILDRLKRAYPGPRSAQIITADQVSVPASSSATITFTIAKGWRAIIRTFYSDALPNTSYRWEFKVAGIFNVNDIKGLSQGIEFEGGESFKLKITNSATSAQAYDYILEGWGEPA